MSRSRGISQKVVVLGMVAFIVVAGLAIYLVQPRNNGSTTSPTKVSRSNDHEGSIDLSKLPVLNTQGTTYYVVPLNLTINYNMSMYSNNGAEFAVPEYVILNYSWTSTPASFAPTVQLGITVQGGFCTGTSDQGSIYGVVSHIVTMLAKATSISTTFTGTFTYSYDLVKDPMVTTIINNGQPTTVPARIGPPFGLCLPGTQAVRPTFTYPLQAPTIGGDKFQGWTGIGPGSYTGPSGNITLTITGNVTESAEYA